MGGRYAKASDVKTDGTSKEATSSTSPDMPTNGLAQCCARSGMQQARFLVTSFPCDAAAAYVLGYLPRVQRQAPARLRLWYRSAFHTPPG